MRRRRRIAHQHDVLVRPLLAQHAPEIEPRRVRRRCSALRSSSRWPPRCLRKDLSQAASVSSLAHRVEAEPAPRRLRAFDDEGRGVGVELVGVRPDPAVLGLLEDESERVLKLLLRAEPDVLAGPHVDVGLEHVAMARADLRVGAVGTRPPDRSRDRRRRSRTRCRTAGSTPSARARSWRMLSRRLRPMPQKPWPDERVMRAAVKDGDVVPIDERAPDRFGAFGIAGVRD